MPALLFILCLHASVYLKSKLDHFPVECVLCDVWWVTVPGVLINLTNTTLLYGLFVACCNFSERQFLS